MLTQEQVHRILTLADHYAQERYRDSNYGTRNGFADRKDLVRYLEQLMQPDGVLVSADWLPTAENINALPEPLRLYIAGLETLCDPAGIVRENTLLKDCNKGLQAMYRKAADAGVPRADEKPKDE